MHTSDDEMTESEDPLFKIKEVPSMKMPGKQLKKKNNSTPR